jgi:hypothetical protein
VLSEERGVLKKIETSLLASVGFLGKVPNLRRQWIGKARVGIGGDRVPEFILPFVESEVCVSERV